MYGDNWFQSVRYTLRCLVAVPQDTDCVETIKSSEEKLAIKKKELEKFQSEFCEIKKKYDAAKERLETDVKEITEFIQVCRYYKVTQFVGESSTTFGFALLLI